MNYYRRYQAGGLPIGNILGIAQSASGIFDDDPYNQGESIGGTIGGVGDTVAGFFGIPTMGIGNKVGTAIGSLFNKEHESKSFTPSGDVGKWSYAYGGYLPYTSMLMPGSYMMQEGGYYPGEYNYYSRSQRKHIPYKLRKNNTRHGYLSKLENKYNLPEGLLAAINFAETAQGNVAKREMYTRDNVISGKKAKGPFQFMSNTGKQYGLEPSERTNFRKSARAAAKKLSKNRKQLGSTELAIAAYNAGRGRANQYKTKGKALPKETQNYLRKVHGYREAILGYPFSTYEIPVVTAKRKQEGGTIDDKSMFYYDYLKTNIGPDRARKQYDAIYTQHVKNPMGSQLTKMNDKYVKALGALGYGDEGVPSIEYYERQALAPHEALWEDINTVYDKFTSSDFYKNLKNRGSHMLGLRSGGLTQSKAKKMLRDGKIHGKPLTDKQKRYFGWVAGGKKQGGGSIFTQGQYSGDRQAYNNLDDHIQNTIKQMAEEGKSYDQIMAAIDPMLMAQDKVQPGAEGYDKMNNPNYQAPLPTDSIFYEYFPGIQQGKPNLKQAGGELDQNTVEIEGGEYVFNPAGVDEQNFRMLDNTGRRHTSPFGFLAKGMKHKKGNSGGIKVRGENAYIGSAHLGIDGKKAGKGNPSVASLMLKYGGKALGKGERNKWDKYGINKHNPEAVIHHLKMMGQIAGLAELGKMLRDK